MALRKSIFFIIFALTLPACSQPAVDESTDFEVVDGEEDSNELITIDDEELNADVGDQTDVTDQIPEPSEQKPETIASEAGGPSNELPGIEARTWPVLAERVSTSTNVYLFRDSEKRQPPERKIFLVRTGKKNLMAFRVLKYYSEAGEFAARKVREYGLESINLLTRFTAIEKVADILPTLTDEEMRDDEKELEDFEKELESGLGDPGGPGAKMPLPLTAAYDPELDAESTPTPEQFIAEDDPDELLKNLVIKEPKVFDPDHHWVSVGLAFLRNSAADGTPAYYQGLGLRYSYTFKKNFWLNSPTLQDSLAAEFGLFLYRVIQYSSGSDAYSVMPTILTLRYQAHLKESLGFFIYAGVMKNFVPAASQAIESDVSSLSSIQPAAGVGLLFQMGPRWFWRADLGFDIAALSLVLRF